MVTLLFCKVIVILVSACAVKSEPAGRVGVVVPAQFSSVGTAGAGMEWWREFGDHQLNKLEARALAGNFSLEAAGQRIRQAEAELRKSRASLGVRIDGTVSGSLLEGGGGSGDTMGLGLGARYEVDLWGRVRSGVRGDEARVRARSEDYRAAAVSISAQVATTWFRLVDTRAQVNLIDEQMATNQKVVQSLEKRFVEGQGRAVDILRQRQLLESSRENRTVAELAVEVLEKQLSLLLGSAPGIGVIPGGEKLRELPSLPRTGLPVELLERRPDVRAEFARIQAANADLAVAMADRYPRLALTGTTGGSGRSSSALFSDWVTRIGADLVAPLVDGGERKAEVARNQAVLKEAIADYRQAVIQAIAEVEIALARERRQLQRIKSLRDQVAMSETSSRQLQREFLNGKRSYLEVLTALDNEQSLRRNVLDARRQLLEYRVALYRALAGGFRSSK